DRAVPAPVAPRLALGRRDVVIVVVPRGLAAVAILGHLRWCPAALVDHGDLVDQVAVPPAEAGAVPFRPPSREAGLRVGVRLAFGEVVDRAAVRLAVLDLHA